MMKTLKAILTTFIVVSVAAFAILIYVATDHENSESYKQFKLTQADKSVPDLSVADKVYIDKTAKHLSGGRVVKTEFDNVSNTLKVYRTLTVDTKESTMNMFAETWCNDFKKYNFDRVEMYYVKQTGGLSTDHSLTGIPVDKVKNKIMYVQFGQATCK